MPVYAALDIGSNSVRLLVAELVGHRLTPLETGLSSTRLLAGATGGLLTPAAIARTVTAARDLLAAASRHNPRQVGIVATSAVRGAANQEDFQAALRLATGRLAAVISGHDEARLSFTGALAGLAAPAARPAVFDLGGGSTEFTWRDGDRLRAFSLPLGAVRCTEASWRPEQIRAALAPALSELKGYGPAPLIGTGGTATTCAALDQGLITYDPRRTHGYTLQRERIKYWLERLAATPLPQRRRLPGLQPQRADIIVAGVAILAAIVDGLALDSIRVSEADLLWGVILELENG